MTLAVLLLIGLIVVALALTLGILASLDLAVRAWDSVSRMDRDARHAVQAQRPASLTAGFHPGLRRWA